MLIYTHSYTYVSEGVMASTVTVKGKNGRRYVYEVESFWNKEKKKPDSHRKCIGHIDEVTGEIVPNRPCRKKGEATKPVAAPSCSVIQNGILNLANKAADETGLKDCLIAAFPTTWDYLLSCALYLCATGQPLYRMEGWSKSHSTYIGEPIVSQRISELLQSIPDEDRQFFFRKWMKQDTEDTCYALDITSVSSYSENIALTKYGYNRDHEKLPQINMLMMTGEKSRLPKYYGVLDGKIKDVSALRSATDHIQTLYQMENAHRINLSFAMDKGFFSQKNIDDLYAKRLKFTLGVPFSSKLAREAVEENRETIETAQNLLSVRENEVYGTTKLSKWNGHRIYIHTYFDPDKYRGEMKDFNHRLKTTYDELCAGEKPDDESFVEKFFIVKHTPKRGTKVLWNEEAIAEHRKSRTGWFVLASNTIKDPEAALRIYRDKDAVEKNFDDLKNEMDMKRLRIHSEKTMEGRLFVQFLALILSTWIKNKMRDANLFKKYSFREVMDELGAFKLVTFSNRKKLVVPQVTKMQEKLAEVFDLDLTSLCITSGF